MTTWNRRSFLGAIIWNRILIETDIDIDIDIELAKDLLKTFGGEMPHPDQLPEWAMQELVSSFKFFATVPTSHSQTLSLHYLKTLGQERSARPPSIHGRKPTPRDRFGARRRFQLSCRSCKSLNVTRTGKR